jgi:hypothetical protein
MKESQPKQSKEGEFEDKGYRAGQVFKRADCLDYDLGFSTYSGEYSTNCDGVVMKFNDGKEVLSDFCKLVEYDCPDVLWAVTKDIEAIEMAAKEKINKIVKEYTQISKTK